MNAVLTSLLLVLLFAVVNVSFAHTMQDHGNEMDTNVDHNMAHTKSRSYRNLSEDSVNNNIRGMKQTDNEVEITGEESKQRERKLPGGYRHYGQYGHYGYGKAKGNAYGYGYGGCHGGKAKGNKYYGYGGCHGYGKAKGNAYGYGGFHGYGKSKGNRYYGYGGYQGHGHHHESPSSSSSLSKGFSSPGKGFSSPGKGVSSPGKGWR